MIIKEASFITSVGSPDKFIKCDKPLIAVSGRSNVGKSSIINMLANRKKLARTSDTPGRTRLVNYFDFGEFLLADLPGYGFAKVSKEEKAKWANLMESFLSTQKLSLILSLVDIRHEPTADDLVMLDYLYRYALPFVIVATKCDKLGKSKVKPAAASTAAFLKVGRDDVIAASSMTGAGKTEILNAIERAINAD